MSRLALVAAIVGIASGWHGGQIYGAAPNVILFLTDDQGWTGTSVTMDHRIAESCSDFYHTPALERLAREGTRFSNGYAPHPNCSPSRASILTGKSPAQLGMTDLIARGSGPYYEGNSLNPPRPVRQLPADEDTIAEFIKRHRPDYRTAHFGKWHIGGRGPKSQGFDEGDGPTDNQTGNVSGDDPKRIFELTSRAIDFMHRASHAGSPFYLQISHYAVHRRIYARASTIESVRQREPGQRHAYVPHAAMTEDLDASLQSILDTLDSLGIGENTYVIFTSDNGAYLMDDDKPATSNLPLAGQKTKLLEGGIRVPFVVRGPRVIAGANSHVPVIGYDLFSTICQWLDITAPLPPGVEGGGLAELLRGEVSTVSRPRDELVWHFPHYQHQRKTTPHSAIRDEKFKLIYDYQTKTARLYNLENDIGESVDISKGHRDVARQLEDRLHRHLSAIGAHLPQVNPDYDPRRDPAMASAHPLWVWCVFAVVAATALWFIGPWRKKTMSASVASSASP